MLDETVSHAIPLALKEIDIAWPYASGKARESFGDVDEDRVVVPLFPRDVSGG